MCTYTHAHIHFWMSGSLVTLFQKQIEYKEKKNPNNIEDNKKKKKINLKNFFLNKIKINKRKKQLPNFLSLNGGKAV